MIRNPLALSGAIALTLAAAAACGPRQEKAAEQAGESAATATEQAAKEVTAAVTPAATPTTAAEFVPMVANTNLFEIEASKLAQEKAQTPAVKDYAKTVVTDVTKLDKDLKAAATKGGVVVVWPTALTGDWAARLAELRAATPTEFDAKYLAMEKEAHESAQTAFQTYADSGDNADIKAVVAAALPGIRAHVEKVAALVQAAPAAAAAAPAKK